MNELSINFLSCIVSLPILYHKKIKVYSNLTVVIKALIIVCLFSRENLKILLTDVNRQKKSMKENGQADL